MGKSKQTCQLVIAAEHISVNGEPSLISVFINRIHGDFADVLAGIESSETDASALVQGIVLGDDSQLSDDMRRSMKNQSLSHLTAVSGSHISILLLAVFSVLGQRRAWLAAIFGALTITVLTLIVGPSASVLRALYMGLFVVFGVGMRRPRDAIALLATTVIVVCFVNPQLSTQIGFILSVLATFGIVSGGSQLAQRISVIMPLWCAELIAIPLIASISTLPVIFTMQSSMSIWGVLANMVIAPVVAPLTICGLAALTVVSFAPHIATLFVWGAYICSRWIIYVVGVIEYFPASHIPTIIVFLSHLLLLFGLIGLARVRPRTRARAKAIIGTRTRRKIHLRTQSFYAAFKSKFLPFITPITAWQRGAAPAQIAFLGLVFLAAILGVHKLVLPVSPTQIADWEIIQCDVGQGSAMLLRASSDTVLVDVGKDPSKIASCLNDNSITTIDLLILSHFDLDHIGGASAIIGKIEVKEIWLSTNPYPLYNSEPLMRTITRHNIPYQSVKAGQSFHNWLRIIHPRSASGGEENTNRDSLVIDAKTATLHTVILSDVPKDVQDDLSNEASEVDVVVVSHHGAKDQSARLAKAYKPKITLVSVGENTYGHPTEEAHKIWDAPMYLTTLECKTIKIGHGEVEASCFDAG
nr:ComEC/Rec2 family competence protein [Arcanobacterium pluranimalium]